MDKHHPLNREQAVTKEELFHQIERELALFSRRAEAIRIAYLQHKNIDRSAYLVLLHLAEEGPLAIKALADTLQVDISTASRQTATLETKGFVERFTAPHDGRVKMLHITETGRDQLLDFSQSRESFYSQLLDQWNEEECRLLGSLLEKFNHTVEQKQAMRIKASELD